MTEQGHLQRSEVKGGMGWACQGRLLTTCLCRDQEAHKKALLGLQQKINTVNDCYVCNNE